MYRKCVVSGATERQKEAEPAVEAWISRKKVLLGFSGKKPLLQAAVRRGLQKNRDVRVRLVPRAQTNESKA